jgi:hypothetical protein
MNVYMHKYAYNYTYICNCDSLIIGEFGSSLYFVKRNWLLYKTLAHPMTKIMFHLFNSSVFPFITSSNVDTY